MAEAELDLKALVDLVRARARDDDALVLLDAAVAVSKGLAERADEVLEHFVLAARRAGRSWTVIGERLGVSKQAARQRFADRELTVFGELELRPRLRACLDQAVAAARQDGRAEVDTQYLLLGLLHAGVAAVALDRLGVTRERVCGSIGRLFAGEPGVAGHGEPAYSQDAAEAIASARGFAQERGHNYVGTEHLLMVLASDPGSQARRVLNDLGVGVDAVKAIKRVLDDLECRPPRRLGRRRRRAMELVCSFCGRSQEKVGPLVAGPGVCICQRCVGLAAEELAS